MRQTNNWEIFCGGDCYKGHPDCLLSTEFFNLRIGTNQKSYFTAEFYFAAGAGVVFNSTLMNDLARCFYIFDGRSVDRYNGGCGCLADSKYMNCQSPYSPFRNVAPDGKFITGNSPDAMRCHCTKDSSTNSGCFWRGPTYNTSTGLYGASEMQQFVEMREKDAPHIGTWDEVVIDARKLHDVLARDPASAFVGVFFFWNSDGAQFNAGRLATAKSVQRALKAKYGVDLPLVGINQSVVVSADRGPFFEYKHEMLDLTEGSQAVVV